MLFSVGKGITLIKFKLGALIAITTVLAIYRNEVIITSSRILATSCFLSNFAQIWYSDNTWGILNKIQMFRIFKMNPICQ